MAFTSWWLHLFVTTGVEKTWQPSQKMWTSKQKSHWNWNHPFLRPNFSPSPKSPKTFRSFSRKLKKKGTRYPCLGQGCGTCIFRIQSFTTPRRPHGISVCGWLVAGWCRVGIFWRLKKPLGELEKKTGAKRWTDLTKMLGNDLVRSPWLWKGDCFFSHLCLLQFYT